jgi:hypothetical protein
MESHGAITTVVDNTADQVTSIHDPAAAELIKSILVPVPLEAKSTSMPEMDEKRSMPMPAHAPVHVHDNANKKPTSTKLAETDSTHSVVTASAPEATPEKTEQRPASTQNVKDESKASFSSKKAAPVHHTRTIHRPASAHHEKDESKAIFSSNEAAPVHQEVSEKIESKGSFSSCTAGTKMSEADTSSCSDASSDEPMGVTVDQRGKVLDVVHHCDESEDDNSDDTEAIDVVMDEAGWASALEMAYRSAGNSDVMLSLSSGDRGDKLYEDTIKNMACVPGSFPFRNSENQDCQVKCSIM